MKGEGDRPTCYSGRSYIGRIGPRDIVGGATWRGGDISTCYSGRSYIGG